MIQHTHTPGEKSVITRRLKFAPVNRGKYGRDASLPEGFPVTVQTTGNETRLFAWVDAPIDGPADYSYDAQASDYRATHITGDGAL
jgi:hypothetical protein